MSEAVILALIATIVPTITVLVTYLSSRRKLRQVHKLVDKQHADALDRIVKLQDKAFGALLAQDQSLITPPDVRVIPPADEAQP